MKEYIILYDCPWATCDKKWLYEGIKELSNDHCKIIEMPITISDMERRGGAYRIIYTKMQMIWQCLRALLNSKNGDVVIIWRHQTGLFFNYMCDLFHCRRNIISMCWLTPGLNGKSWAKYLTRKYLSNPYAYAVVNSKSSQKQYNTIYGIESSRYLYLPDTIDNTIGFKGPNPNKPVCYFTGGMNNRDWNIIIGLAQNFPNSIFVCAALKSDWNSKVKGNIPSNVEVFFNVESERYYQLMENSKFVLLPLCNNIVSGLINITMSAQLGVPCIATHTEATAQYYNEESPALVEGGIESWKLKIKYLESLSSGAYCNLVTDMQSFINSEFNPAKNTQKIYEVFN